MSLPTFSSNYVTDGKLFKRKHGYSFSIAANELKPFEVVVPYASCKIDRVEILGCSLGDSVNFKILDDDLGTYTAIPKQQLNQYGFGVKLSEGKYQDQSKYEANLTSGLYIAFEYQENSSQAKDIYINIDFHEVI